MAVKTFAWNAPLAQVTGATATAVAGGSLAASTTYYYKVVAITEATGFDEQIEARRWGQASAEFSATTTATNKSISLSWSAVPGADAYYVFRTTSPGDYSGTKKFKRLSDQANDQPTLTTTSFTDNGTYGFRTTNCVAVLPSTYPTIAGLDITTYYGGILDIYGGDAADPITFKDIYDWMVTNVTGYQNYVAYDNYRFAALFTLNFQVGTNTVYFKETNKVCVLTKKTIFSNTQSGSAFIFGEIDSASGLPKNGVRFVQLGSRVAICNFGDNAELYDCTWRVLDSTYWKPTGSNNIVPAEYIDIGNAKAVNGFATIGNRFCRTFSNVLKKNIKFMIDTLEIFTASQLAVWKVTVLQRFSHAFGATGGTYRTDESVAYGGSSTQQITMRNNHANGTIANFVNCSFPNSGHSEQLPSGIFWSGTNDTSLAKLLYSLEYKAIDKNANPIQNAIIEIRDVNGNLAKDYDGTDITRLNSNINGDIFRERITISSTTANTITDSTKSWTIDQWAGRMVRISETGEQHKVMSNTSTTLTLAENLVITPTVNTRAGIILEVLRWSAVHTPGGSSTDSNITEYAPFKVRVTASGYETFTEPIRPSQKIQKTIVLNVRHYPRSQRS